MFEGELASLAAIHKSDTIQCPKPITVCKYKSISHSLLTLVTFFQVFDLEEGGAALVMEYVEMRPLGSKAWELGEQLAKYV